MRHRIAASILATLALPAPLCAHGGAYRGPGDSSAGSATVAPSGGGGSSGGSPSAPQGGGSSSGGPSSGPSAGGKSAPSGGGGSTSPDATRWQTWWGFNKDAYLDIKAQVLLSDVLAGSDEALLGGAGVLTRDQLRPAPDVVRQRVVPALLAALERERSNDILSGVLIALAKIGDEPGKSEIAQHIRPFLADANQELAETAAVALGILGDESNLELMRELLLGQADAVRARGVPLNSGISERTRAFAAFALGLAGQRASMASRERIVATLSDWMRREGSTQRQSEVPVGCTIAFGLVPLALDPMVEAPKPGATLRRPDEVLTREEQILWLVATLADPQSPDLVRAHAPTSMARLLDDVPQSHWIRALATRELLARLERRSEEVLDVRTSCVLALGRIGDCDGDPLDASVRAALADVRERFHEQQLGYFAMIALAQVAGRPGSGDAPTAGLDPSRQFLLAQLDKGTSATRCYAALALGVLEAGLDRARLQRSESVLATLRSGLEQAKSPDESGAFAIALGIARDAGASSVLRAKLEAVSDHDGRGYVALALGLIGDRGAIGRIQEVVAKARYQPDLLRQAAIALGLLGDKQAVPQLIEMLAAASTVSSQAAIASALGWIGDARSIDPLVAMLADEQHATALARAFAAVALGICADDDERPWNAAVSIDSNYRANTATLYSPETGTGVLDIL